jgi:hypothetical protein
MTSPIAYFLLSIKLVCQFSCICAKCFHNIEKLHLLFQLSQFSIGTTVNEEFRFYGLLQGGSAALPRFHPQSLVQSKPMSWD